MNIYSHFQKIQAYYTKKALACLFSLKQLVKNMFANHFSTTGVDSSNVVQAVEQETFLLVASHFQHCGLVLIVRAILDEWNIYFVQYFFQPKRNKMFPFTCQAYMFQTTNQVTVQVVLIVTSCIYQMRRLFKMTSYLEMILISYCSIQFEHRIAVFQRSQTSARCLC